MSARVLTMLGTLAAAFVCMLQPSKVAAATPIASSGGNTNAGIQMGTTGVGVNGIDVTVNAGLTQGTGGSGSAATTGSTTTCTSQAVDSFTAVGLINQYPTATVSSGPPGEGTWYVTTCPGTTPSLVFVSASGRAGNPVAQPSVLAQQALATMRLPGPSVKMSPPSDAQVVNFKDWLWVDPSSWHPISATATAGPVSATATATPERVVYDMGNGTTITCNGPGTPYDPNTSPDAQSTNCGYTYASSSAGQPDNRYPASATIYWSVRWTAAGAPGGGSLGEIPGGTTSTPVRVDEIQAVNVARR
jgi:hypothetical protein